MKNKGKRVLVALSGGVDSSTAAYLLKEQGYDVVGVTMCLGIKSPSTEKVKCCGSDAIDDAKKVCNHIGIAHYLLDFSKQMKEFVIDDFVNEYLLARTPNPCIRCNEYLKFGKLLDYAKAMDFDFLATGHYAKIENINGKTFLKKAKDKKKDQTYFLYRINKDSLKSIIFPLYDYTKEEVREIAKKANLPVASKPQSQDICFIPGKKYKDFIDDFNPGSQKGDIVDKNGKVLGKHKGILNYTLGQRTGLGVSSPRPLYVIALDKKDNLVIVGDKKDLKAKILIADKFHSLMDDFPSKLKAKIRFAHQESWVDMANMGQGRIKVVFEHDQEAITPGQSIVFYDRDIVCGGAIISEVEKNNG